MNNSQKSNSQRPPFDKGRCKDSHFPPQLKKVFLAFFGPPQTMLMVSDITGIERANICYHVAEMRRHGAIKYCGEGFCQVSKNRAGFYTTDLDFFCENDNPQKSEI